MRPCRLFLAFAHNYREQYLELCQEPRLTLVSSPRLLFCFHGWLIQGYSICSRVLLSFAAGVAWDASFWTPGKWLAVVTTQEVDHCFLNDGSVFLFMLLQAWHGMHHFEHLENGLGAKSGSSVQEQWWWSSPRKLTVVFSNDGSAIFGIAQVNCVFSFLLPSATCVKMASTVLRSCFWCIAATFLPHMDLDCSNQPMALHSWCGSTWWLQIDSLVFCFYPATIWNFFSGKLPCNKGNNINWCVGGVVATV